MNSLAAAQPEDSLVRSEFKPSIMIVTVDPGITQVLEILLNNPDYKIQLTNSGAEAIEQLQKKRADLMLLDTGVPGMDALEIIGSTRTISPSTLILALVPEESFPRTVEYLKAGAYDYLRKPYEREEILRRVGNALNSRRLAWENDDLQRRTSLSRERFDYLVENSPIIVYSLDREGRFTFLNDQTLQILGYRREELLGRHFSLLIVPEDLEKARYCFHERRTTSRGGKRVELRLKTAGAGEESDQARQHSITIELRARGFYDRAVDSREKMFLGTYGIGRDITDSRHRDLELQLQKAYFQQLFQGSPAAIAILDSRRRVREINRGFESLFQYTLEEARNRPLADLILPADDGPVEPVPGESEEPEVVRRRKDGSLVDVSVYGCPIVFRRRQVGYYEIYRDLADRRRSEKQLENTLEKLRRAMGGIIHAMVSTVEARDPYTAGHQQRVADLARAIGFEMGLPREEIDGIRMAGTIHDLGKVNIPAEILSKPGKLTDIEFNLIKIHPKVGYDILREIEFPWPVADIVYQHHERLDGSGYPQGLQGREILPAARVLIVADVVEAIASHRPYRPSLGMEAAMREISDHRGTYYDGPAVDACLRLFREKRFALPAPEV